jgi:hypothetical protein
MGRILAAQGSLIIGISLVQLVNGYMGTLVGIRLASAGTDAFVTGIVTSAFFCGYVTGSILCKVVIQNSGHIRAFAAFAATVAIAVLGLVLHFDPVLWTIFRLMTGFGCAGLFVATESWLSVKSTIETRGTVFSIYMVATYLTFAGSQFVLLLGSPEGALLFELGAIILCLAIILVATTRSEQPAIAAIVRLKLGEVLRAAPVAVVGCFVAGINSGAFFGLMPVFGQASGLPVFKISSYIALGNFWRHAAPGSRRQSVRQVRPARGCRPLRACLCRTCGDNPPGACDARFRTSLAAARRVHVGHLSGLRGACQRPDACRARRCSQWTLDPDLRGGVRSRTAPGICSHVCLWHRRPVLLHGSYRKPVRSIRAGPRTCCETAVLEAGAATPAARYIRAEPAHAPNEMAR